MPLHEPFYTLTTPGVSPVGLAEMKSYMKVTTTADDVFIQLLIDACTEYGQKYTAREFTNNTYVLLLDCLTDRIRLNRNPIATITSIEHLLNTVFTLIPATDYYKKDLTQWAEILLEEGKSWPTDTDDKEHAIKITFVTKSYNCGNLIKNAIMIHVLNMYENRGDCDCDCANSSIQSGAKILYDTIRIPRI